MIFATLASVLLESEGRLYHAQNMNVDGIQYRTIWLANDGWAVEIIDQTKLPHMFDICRLETIECAADAIKHMLVRGAPLIGATAAYGVALAARSNPADSNLHKAYNMLIKARPTAINLRWALLEMLEVLLPLPVENRIEAAYKHAKLLCDKDVENCQLIGKNGSCLIEKIFQLSDKKDPVNEESFNIDTDEFSSSKVHNAPKSFSV